MARDDRSRQLGQLAAPRTPDDGIAKGTASIADRGDGREAPISPESIVGMLAAWVDIKMGEVDDLIDDARSRAAAIPNQRQLWLLFGETLVRLHALEQDVAELRDEVGRLRKRGRVA